MYLSYGTVVLLVVVAIVVWFWQDSLRARDVANDAAMRACADLQLQFLDGTAAFSRLRLVRDLGRLSLQRTYVFDYTAQTMERLQGFVVMTGWRIDSVGFARPTHAAPRSGPASNPSSNSASDSASNPASGPTSITGSVTSLDQWRRRP